MKVTLKDGSVKEYAQPMSVYEIALDISEGLARVATAGEIDGEEVDLRTVVDKDCELNILTFNDEKGKGAFRHTASHIMAQAIKRLYPDAKLAIGPSIADLFALCLHFIIPAYYFCIIFCKCNFNFRICNPISFSFSIIHRSKIPFFSRVSVKLLISFRAVALSISYLLR